jgi:hypothetical protein
MNIRFLLIALLAAGLTLRAFADEPTKEATPPKQATKEEIQARLAEHTRKKEAKAAADKEAAGKAAATLKADTAATAAPVAPPQDYAASKTATAPTATAAGKPAAEAAQVLPKVDVRKGRITELDVQLAKQNEEIAREKVNTKPTKLDETLNGPKISTALAIFGGQSSDDRANVAKERVAMMEEEKEIIEAISQAQTKEEKAELEKLLAEMKATRRELEQSLK